MSLRSAFSRRTTADAVRRMRAVVGVLDHDLAQLAAQLAAPIPSRSLSNAEWEAAEAARSAVELDLRQLEAEATVVAAQANDWRAKAVLAEKEGRSSLAEHAHARAVEAEQILDSYRQEISAVRVFLLEWATRVTRADSGRASTPLADER